MKWVQRLLWGYGFVCLSLGVAEASSCTDLLKSIRESSLRRLVRNSLQVVVAPYWFPVKVARGLLGSSEKELWVSRVEFGKDLSRAAAGYLIYGLVPGRFVLTINDFHAETDEEFGDIDSDDLMVVVDGFKEDSFLDSKRKLLLKILVEEKRAQGKNIVYVAPKNSVELAARLNELRRLHGPIKRMDVYSHGVEFGAIEINENWIRNSHLEEFYDIVDADLMAPDSIVRINSCLVGRNEAFLKRFASSMMLDGGQVFASKLITVPSGTAEFTEFVLEKDMPASIDRMQNYLTGNLLNFVWIAYLKLTSRSGESIPSAWDPITKLRIEKGATPLSP